MAYLLQLSDNRGVSPVIGVVLMIAVTVMLAAAIAGFAIGFDTTPNTPPQVQWELSVDTVEEEVVIRHGGGEPIDPAEIRIEGDAVTVERLSSVLTERFAVGERVNMSLEQTGGDLILVWDPDGAEATILAEWNDIRL